MGFGTASAETWGAAVAARNGMFGGNYDWINPMRWSAMTAIIVGLVAFTLVVYVVRSSRLRSWNPFARTWWNGSVKGWFFRGSQSYMPDPGHPAKVLNSWGPLHPHDPPPGPYAPTSKGSSGYAAADAATKLMESALRP